MTSPTKRTLALLRKLGYRVAVVERWNAFAKIRQDLFGFIDVLAIRKDEPGVLGVQATTRANQAARMAKILEAPALVDWICSGNRVEVHGWAKVGPRGKRKTWQVTRQEVSK